MKERCLLFPLEELQPTVTNSADKHDAIGDFRGLIHHGAERRQMHAVGSLRNSPTAGHKAEPTHGY